MVLTFHQIPALETSHPGRFSLLDIETREQAP